MKRFLFLGAFAILPVASDAAAETLSILDRKVEFDAPAGYCLLDRSDAYQDGIFNFFAELHRTGGAELLAIYSECDELAEVVARRLDHFVHYGMLLVLPSVDGAIAPVAGGTRQGYIAHVSTVMSQASGESGDAVAQVNREIGDLGITLTELSEPAIIGTDDNAFYAAYRSTLDSGGVAVPVVTISAYTMVAELPLINNLSAPAGDEAVLEALFGIQSALMADFVAANE